MCGAHSSLSPFSRLDYDDLNMIMTYALFDKTLYAWWWNMIHWGRGRVVVVLLSTDDDEVKS